MCQTLMQGRVTYLALGQFGTGYFRSTIDWLDIINSS
ncbi:MAG: hypothetical protein KatS3mg049_1020 [Caldilinea sp.]|nr:MAG: hypothetical protein KatS3mg049_1020 [Caldilinea sp.]